MRDKLKTLEEIRAKWAELAQNVWERFRIRVAMPKRIYYVENNSFLARVWTLPNSVEKLEINSKCLKPENWDYFLATTITHEFCHAFNRAKGNDDSHGDGWKLCMRLMGVYPSRCGEWPSDKVKSGNLRPVCSNSNIIDLGDAY